MSLNIDEAINEAGKWLDIDGVEGVGQGERNGKECIIVFASQSQAELGKLIPKKFKGFAVVFDESDTVFIQE